MNGLFIYWEVESCFFSYYQLDSPQTSHFVDNIDINSLNDELNPICLLLALLGAHHILHVRRIKVNVK